MGWAGRHRRLERCRLRDTGLVVLASMFALCLAPASLLAQTLRAVNAAQVEVRKAPTTSSAVIGHATRGQSVEVTREVGDWVQVVWPAAPDRIGYVRVRFGATPVTSLSEPRSGSMAASNSAPMPNPASEGRVERRDAASVTTSPVLREPLTRAAPQQRLSTACPLSRFRCADGSVPRHRWNRPLLVRLRDRRADGSLTVLSVERPFTGTTDDVLRVAERALSASGSRAQQCVDSPVRRQRYRRGAVDAEKRDAGDLDERHQRRVQGVRWWRTDVCERAAGVGQRRPRLSLARQRFTGFDVSGVRASFAGHWYIK